jgi:hypothetical protein
VTTVAAEKTFVRYCNAAVATLNARRQMTDVIGHNVSAGAAREAILRDFLAAHLPEMTTGVSGVIFDASGTCSRQQDIVFLLKSFPRLPSANGGDLIFVEGVVATVEIKSNITPADWKMIAENIASVRRLTPTEAGSGTFGDLTWDDTRVLSAVVTYGGSPLQTILRRLDGEPEASLPDMYLDLQRGMLVRNTGLLPRQSGEAFLLIEPAGPALAHFLVILAKLTGRLVFRGVDWDSYLR